MEKTTQTRPFPFPDPFKAPKDKVLTASFKAVAAVIIFTVSMSLALYCAFYGDSRPVLFLWPETTDRGLYMAQMNSDHYRTNISHIAFGIAGSIQTWKDRGRYSELWWKTGATRGFVFLERKPDRWRAGEFKIRPRVSSNWRKFRRSAGSESAVRIARVVVDLFRSGLPNVRWFVMGDDDTVFFVENLVEVLDKYDHREMVYVGGSSESVEQDVMHSYDMAFGGGGFAISYPLAAELVSAMDGCLDRYHYFYGSDQRVSACVGEYGVGLSRESGFHQIDIRGDAFGLLAAHPLAPLVSLHHLDAVKPLFPNRTQIGSISHLMEAYTADPSRTLQQCFCYDRKHKWSVSISWGYAVQIYPILLTAADLKTPLLTFKTWRSWKDGPFTFNTRPMSSNPCEQPVVFYFDKVKGESGNETVTSYKKFEDKMPEKSCDANHASAWAIADIVVSASKMDPDELKQGPRRQCCEITGVSGEGSMAIKIRKCKQTESLSI